jgi:hypothetical protein
MVATQTLHLPLIIQILYAIKDEMKRQEIQVALGLKHEDHRLVNDGELSTCPFVSTLETDSFCQL